MANELNINNLYKRFMVDGKSVSILEDINLTIKEGEFIVIVGHSGCGKSTLLKIIAGLDHADEGTIINNGAILKEPGMDRGMVFQEHRLFPWLTVKDNVAIGLDRYPKAEKERLVDEHLQLVHLSDFKNAYPSQLSGGMSQRTAIARGLINNPKILLLDEPFGALDALTKIELQQEIVKIWQTQKTTMIMVTHDIEEAVYLADRIVVMSSRPGNIKDVIKVELARNRDRGSSDFARYKKRIYNYFFEDNTPNIEYDI